MEAVAIKSTYTDELRGKGMLGSAEDPMWDGTMHQCCASKLVYYHKATCRMVKGRIVLEAKDRTYTNDAGNIVRLNKHIKKKNHDLVAAMYAMYQNGNEDGPASIATVAKMYKRSRQAVFELFKSRGYPLRSKKLKGLMMIDGIRFTEMKQGYLRGTVPGRGRMMAHHYVWERERGVGAIPEGYVLAFRDGDKRHVDVENLELVPLHMMSQRFNPHHNNQHKKK